MLLAGATAVKVHAGQSEKSFEVVPPQFDVKELTQITNMSASMREQVTTLPVREMESGEYEEV